MNFKQNNKQGAKFNRVKTDNKKVCVVGAGQWGKNHIRTLHNLNALGGIVDNNEDVLVAFRDNYPKAKLYTSVEEALEDNFDGFTVATPVESHFEIAKTIIEHNHHILVEKPITLNTADAIILNELSKENSVNLMVGHVLLFHPAFRKIKNMLQNGIIGDLQYIYSNRLNLGTIRTEENVFWSLAPHDISLFQLLTESFPEKVTSRGTDILQDGIHDSTITTLEYPDNVMGHIFVSWLHPFKEHRFVVVGSKGMIRFEDSQEEKPLIFYDKGVDWQAGKPIPRNGPTSLVEYNNTLPLTVELKYFVDHLDGEPVEISNGQDAIDVMKILEAATESLLATP